MNGFVDVLLFVVPAVAIVVAVFVVVRLVSPFVDHTALFRARPDDAWPHGVQEEEPHAWGLSAPGAGDTTAGPPGHVEPSDAGETPGAQSDRADDGRPLSAS